MPSWILTLIPSLFKAAATAVAEKKPILDEIKKSVGLSIKPADNKRAAIATLVASTIALLGSWGVTVSPELQGFIVAAFYAYAVLFLVSKPQKKGSEK